MAVFRLFFSNKRADQGRVDRLKSNLKDILPNLPFVDASTDVPFADDWQTQASEIIESCDAFICVVGPETHGSEPVDWEIRKAHSLGKQMAVTRLSPDCRLPPACGELRISPLEWEDGSVAAKIGELLVPRAVFLKHDWQSGNPDPAVIRDQYTLMVQSWEALIARRQTVNTLYVSATAALLAGVGVILSSLDKTGAAAGCAGAALLAFIGAVLSFNWRRTVVSYGVLSRAKSKVVAAMEAYMPAQLFDAEWRVLEASRYKSTTQTDSQSALVFLLLFVVVMVAAAGLAFYQAL